MKLSKIFFALLLFVIILKLPVFAQSDTAVLKRIIAKTTKIYNDDPIEKVYLHFDKPYYAVGDTIWFKAYLTIDNHLPSPLSKIIYVDILTIKDSLITSLKLQVKNSVAWADIPLSQYIYKKGNYRIVAFTNWMNNSDPAYFFNKIITIGDAINNQVATQVALKKTGINKQSKITAGIYFKDDEGNPYTDKKVSWTVQKDYDDLIKGKGTTDKNGFVDINFINVKNYNLDSARMATVIDIGNRKQVTNSFPLKSVSGNNDIQFFPEGGGLVVGLRTKVAFKAIKPNGLGIDLKGNITDNDNKTVAEFTSSHLGMGYFMLTPEDGKTYTAHINFSDGSSVNTDLPKIQTGGINLALDNSITDVLKIKLQADPPFVQAYQNKTFFILAKSGGVIYFAAQTKLQSQFYNASVPKSKFPTGIVQLTLFSEDGDPISERIAFIQHNDQLSLSINSDHTAYLTRQKVKLNITVKNNNLPVEGNFSIAVVDESKVPVDENAENTILTNLLLTSDLKGYIEQPNYYFNHPDEKKLNDLDILMQTQGYRRFSYDGIMSDKHPVINFFPEQGIEITGTLRASSGIALNNGNVRLLIRDKNYSENTLTNADGRFKFSKLMFLDSTKVNLSARNNAKANDLVLSLDGELSQRISKILNSPDEILNIDSVLNPYLKNSKIQYSNLHILKEVVIRDTKITPKVSHKDFGSLSSLSSEPDHLIRGSQLKDCSNVLDCIKVLAIGMTFDENNFYVLRDFTQGKKIPAQVFVKGMPVDVNFLFTLSPDAIESVEIFVKDELGLVNSAYNTNGAIVVNLKKVETTKVSLRDLEQLIPPKNEVTFMPKGYAVVRTFYLPRYNGPKDIRTNNNDRRSTIYWNPNVITDKTTGAASLEYFNADGTGTYRAIVEGIDKDGNIGRQVYRYSVK